MRIVNHICEVNLITLLQNILIVMIHFFRNIKEQQCSGIIRLLSEDLKSRLVVSGSLILFNKVHHKQYELITGRVKASGAFLCILSGFRVDFGKKILENSTEHFRVNG